jgi:predicted transcriptional regulator
MELKLQAKKYIMGAVHEAGSLDKKKLIADLCLRYGFREITIQTMLNQLAELGYILLENNTIKKIPPEPVKEALP